MKTNRIVPLLMALLPLAGFAQDKDSINKARTGEWPQWRGADRSNASQETGLLQEWPDGGPPLAWRVTGLGEGIHSVSVAGGRVFTVGNRNGAEFVFALDEKTGQKLWAACTGETIAENPHMRWLTQRTPTVDGDRVYSFASRGELFCLSSATGAKMWQRSYPSEFGARTPAWGFCDRPMVDGDRLICTPFGKAAFVAALDKRTGEMVWQTLRESTRYCTGDAALIVTEGCGVRQYVVFHSDGLSGFAADDGRLLWDYPRPVTRTGESYTPIAEGERLYSPNGYGGGLVGIELIRDGAGIVVRELYQSHLFRFNAFQDSTAHVGGYLYAINSRVPACIELKTGRSTWNGDWPPQAGSSALTYADGCLYLRDVNGTMSLLQVSPDARKLVGSFKIPDHEESIGVTAPVVAGGRLYLRDGTRLFCYDLSVGAPAKRGLDPLPAELQLTAEEINECLNINRTPSAGVNRLPDAVFVPTPPEIVERMLEEAGVKKGEVVVDLGSGDGRIVIAAAKKYGCKAIGYEIDPYLVEISRKAAAKEKLQELVTFEHADLFTVDLSGADVVTTFLYPHLMTRLIPQLWKLKPGSRIISYQFELPGAKPDRELDLTSKETGEARRILLWTTPFKK